MKPLQGMIHLRLNVCLMDCMGFITVNNHALVAKISSQKCLIISEGMNTLFNCKHTKTNDQCQSYITKKLLIIKHTTHFIHNTNTIYLYSNVN